MIESRYDVALNLIHRMTTVSVTHTSSPFAQTIFTAKAGGLQAFQIQALLSDQLSENSDHHGLQVKLPYLSVLNQELFVNKKFL